MVLLYLLILIYAFTSRDDILIALECSNPYTCATNIIGHDQLFATVFDPAKVEIIESCPNISNCSELAIRFVVNSAPTHYSKHINECVQ
jgi:hypothetical protein